MKEKQAVQIIIFVILSYSLLIPCRIFSQSTATSDVIVGKWLTEEKDGIVQIYKKDGKYYGKLVWIKNSNDKDGKPKKDINNPDEKLRSRPIQGMVFIRNFVYISEDQEWGNGKIYDPQSGNTYDAYIKLKNKDTLLLRGYLGFSLLGRTSTWTRKE